MSLLFIDGFDHYGPVDRIGARLRDGVYSETNLGVGGGVITTNPRTGSSHVRWNGGENDAGLRRALVGGPVATLGAAFAFSLSELPRDNRSLGLFQWRNGANQVMASVWVTSTGQVAVVEGGRSGSEVTVSEVCVYPDAYQHFEAVNGPAGLEVRINGVTVANTGYVAAVAGPIAQYKFGANSYPLSGAINVMVDMDDVAVWDTSGAVNNDFLGDVKVYTRFPSSDGPAQGWTPSAGEEGFPMLDNVPPQDATEYVMADQLGSPPDPIRSEYGVADFPEEIVAVRGVQLSTRMWKTDAGNAKVSAGVNVGPAEDLADPWPLSMAPVWYADVFEADPSTGTAWSLEALNQMDTSLNRVE